MRAVILAGGKGTRLAPYTTVLPKPLMPVGDVPILEVVVRQLRHYGFDRITLAVGHLAELLMAYFGDGGKFGVHIDYSREERPMGTAGALGLVPDLDDTFLLMNGDVLTTLNYVALMDYHRTQGGLVTIACNRRGVHVDLGVVESDSQNRLVEYIEKPTLHYQASMGIYVFEPDVLRHLQPGQPLDFPELIRRLLAAGREVVTYPFDGYWLDIGRPDDYAQAASDFDRLRELLVPGP
jgi:NDP-sugar pyrophosphorylase family protein